MKKPRRWLAFYVNDYLKDTRELTVEQHGAYMLLLWAAWQHDGELPNDRGAIRRMISGNIDPRLFNRLFVPLLDKFFVVSPSNVLINKRLSLELTVSRSYRLVTSKNPTKSKVGVPTYNKINNIHRIPSSGLHKSFVEKPSEDTKPISYVDSPPAVSDALRAKLRMIDGGKKGALR